jgi:hypothetical protein
LPFSPLSFDVSIPRLAFAVDPRAL